MKGRTAVWSDWLPEYNEEVLNKHNRAKASILTRMEEMGPIWVAERLMQLVGDYTEEKWHIIQYTAHRKEARAINRASKGYPQK